MYYGSFRAWLINGLFILFSICFPSVPVLSQNGSFSRTIVIDPGHGGHDPGALGRQSKEKNINLRVALKLGNLIQRNLKNVRVIYTRDRDNFVELYRRAEIANKNKADLFISIHCNANKNKTLQGAETYVMGLHKSKANLDIAKLENASILLESDYQATYEGFDPNSDESYILFNLYQNANLERSTEFAAKIQAEMTGKVGMQNRGVRQAGFLVLYKTAMPSVLVECGYISNSADEKFLSSEKGQDFIATAIFNAYKTFNSPGDVSREPVSLSQTDDSAIHVLQDAKPPVSDPPPAKKKEEKTVPAGHRPEFRIQVATSAKELPPSAKIFADFKNVRFYRHGGLYKYTVGSYDNLLKTKEMLEAVRNRGYSDSFIVIFRNNERIPQSEADKIMRE